MDIIQISMESQSKTVLQNPQYDINPINDIVLILPYCGIFLSACDHSHAVIQFSTWFKILTVLRNFLIKSLELSSNSTQLQTEVLKSRLESS